MSFRFCSSDVPILDTLMSFAYVRRHASFPLASHLAVSSNAVRVGYAVVRFNRVRIELTFYHYSLKRTHNLGLEGGLNFRWQYKVRGILIENHTVDVIYAPILEDPKNLAHSLITIKSKVNVSKSKQKEAFNTLRRSLVLHSTVK